jgi:hypothetical protein
MWPLTVVFLFALNAPQQNAPASGQDFRVSKLTQMKSELMAQQDGLMAGQDSRTQKVPQFKAELKVQQRYVLEQRALWPNTCFTVRSYVFRRDDERAPKLVSTTTCTPGNTVRTLRVSPAPARLVPAK